MLTTLLTDTFCGQIKRCAHQGRFAAVLKEPSLFVCIAVSLKFKDSASKTTQNKTGSYQNKVKHSKYIYPNFSACLATHKLCIEQMYIHWSRNLAHATTALRFHTSSLFRPKAAFLHSCKINEVVTEWPSLRRLCAPADPRDSNAGAQTTGLYCDILTGKYVFSRVELSHILLLRRRVLRYFVQTVL